MLEPVVNILKVFEDLTVLIAEVKVGDGIGLSDFDKITKLASDLKSAYLTFPDLTTAMAGATPAEWEQVGGRAISDLIAFIKLLAVEHEKLKLVASAFVDAEGQV